MENTKQKISIRRRQTLREALPSWFLLIALIIMGLIFYSLNKRIYSNRSINNILATASFSGIISLGLMMVMTTGTFDLSIAMKAALAASVVGYMCKDGTDGIYVQSIIIGLLVAGLAGVVHGFLSVTLGIPGFIAALSLRFILQGIIALLSNNTIFYSNEWGNRFKVLGQGKLGIIPYPFFIFIGFAILCWIFMERTRTGRHIYATGANITAARQAGIKVSWMQYLSFIIGGMIAGVGGILFSSRNFNISYNIGLDLQMPSMTCCLLGATFFEPGKYNVPGCVLGSIFVSLLTTGIFSVVISSPWLNSTLQGVAFLAALAIIAKTKENGLSKVEFDL